MSVTGNFLNMIRTPRVYESTLLTARFMKSKYKFPLKLGIQMKLCMSELKDSTREIEYQYFANNFVVEN